MVRRQLDAPRRGYVIVERCLLYNSYTPLSAEGGMTDTATTMRWTNRAPVHPVYMTREDARRHLPQVVRTWWDIFTVTIPAGAWTDISECDGTLLASAIECEWKTRYDAA
jgi:maltooligosyltrehalose synthase